jgi:dihydroorotase
VPENAAFALRNFTLSASGASVDIVVTGGRIVSLGPAVAGKGGMDCEGALVSPAWVDSHAHVRSSASPGRVDARGFGPAQGVGALVDAGSAPPARLGELLDEAGWVYALANIDSRGIRGDASGGPEISGGAADEALARFPGRARGIKVQASQSVLGELSLTAIGNAIRVAEGHGVAVMVHVGNPPPPLEAVCDLLRPGDLITHYAHGKPEGATLADGAVLPALRRAYERGVRLDVGHGRSSFSFRRFRLLLDAGIRPWSISTDLHAASAETPVVSLARTISKVVALGLPEREAIDAVTMAPVRSFGLKGFPARVEVGAPARLTVFRIEESNMETEDSTGARLVCGRWFRPAGCFLDDTWYPATGAI